MDWDDGEVDWHDCGDCGNGLENFDVGSVKNQNGHSGMWYIGSGVCITSFPPYGGTRFGTAGCFFVGKMQNGQGRVWYNEVA